MGSSARWIVTVGASLLAAMAAGAWFGLQSSPKGLSAGAKPIAANDQTQAALVAGLSTEHRKHIWETEYVAFQLSYKTGPLFSRHVVHGDRDQLIAYLADGFQGAIFASPGEAVWSTPPLHVTEWRNDKQPRKEVDRAAFIDWILEHARRFSGQPLVDLLVPFCSPVDPTDLAGEWEATLILRMDGESDAPAEKTAAAAVDRPLEMFSPRYEFTGGKPLEIVITGKARVKKLPADYSKGTGWIDSWRIEHVATTHADRLLLEDTAHASGLEPSRLHDNWKVARNRFVTTPGGVYACNFNGDEAVDLLITDGSIPRLYAGDGKGSFRDVSTEVGLPWNDLFGAIACFADLDNDGDEDAMLGTTILENRNGRFFSRGKLRLEKHATGYSVGDYDKDGLIDVYVSYAAPPPGMGDERVSWIDDESGIPNVLYKNLGGFQFADVTESANAAGGRRSTFTTLWLDANDDNWPDLYVLNELGNNVLLVNQQNGTFAERHVGPTNDGFAMGGTAGDINGDGTIDVYLGNMKSKVGRRILANMPRGAYSDELLDKMRRWVGGNLVLLNRSNLAFEESSAQVAGNGWSYAPALFDLDGDGRLDIHSTCGYASFSRREPDG